MFASGISRIHRFIPFDRLWLRSRQNKMLGPARTPRDATERTETAAARLRA